MLPILSSLNTSLCYTLGIGMAVLESVALFSIFFFPCLNFEPCLDLFSLKNILVLFLDVSKTTSQTNGKPVYPETDIISFPILERATTSMAPVNHRHHVMSNGGDFSISNAPEAFLDRNGSCPSPFGRENSGINDFSPRSQNGATSPTSLSKIEVQSQSRTPMKRKLQPIPNHQVLVKKLTSVSNTQCKTNTTNLNDNVLETSSRSSTPISV